jgi:hypothetical protein
MDPLLITTKVDLSGVNQLATGTESAMARVVAAQLRVKAETAALKDAYATLGPSASAGSAAATAAIAEHEASLVAASNALKGAKAAVDELNSSEERETATLAANISARQSATASISLAEGRMMGANRAAGAFLATTLGIGPALQAAFPIIGALALFEVLIHVGSAIKDATDALVGWDKEAKAAYENVEKANRKLIEDQVTLKIGTTELGTVGKEGAAKAQAEVQKWTEQQKILQEAIATTAQSLSLISTKIDELKARGKINPQQLLEQSTGIVGAAIEAIHPAPKAPPEPVHIDSTDNIENLTKKQEELTQEVEKYRQKLLEIQQIHKPGAQALVPIAEARQAQELGAAAIEAREKADTANVTLAQATAKHLLDIGKSSAAEEVFAFGEGEQQKIAIRIRTLEQLNTLKQKSPTYSTDASAQADVSKNQGEIAGLKTQQQTIAIETADKAARAETEAQIHAVDLQVDAAKRGTQAKIDLTQEEVNIAIAEYGKQGPAYDAAIAKNLAAIQEFEEERSRLLERDIRLTTEEATQEAKTAEQVIKAKQDELAATTDIQNRQIEQRRSGAGGRTAGVLDIGLIRSTYQQQIDLANSAASQQIVLAQQAGDAQIKEQEAIITANRNAASEDTVNQQREIDAIAAASAKELEIRQQTQTQITAIQAKAAKERAQIEQQEAQQAQASQQKYFGAVNADLNTLVSDWIIGHKRMGQEIENMLAKGLVDLAQYAAQWLAKKAEMYILEKVFHATASQEEVALDAAAAAEDAAATSAANTAAASSYIGVAATGAAASQAAIPIVGPELAVAAAASMVGALSPFLALATFETGGIVPRTGIAMVHADEGVLTPDQTSNLRDAASNKGFGSNQSSGAQIGALHLHYSPTINGVTDPKQVGEDSFKYLRSKLRRMGVQV